MSNNKEITKSELISELAKKGEISETEARRNLDLLSETVMDLMKENDKLILGNLGKIIKSKSKARTGRNPRTGEPLEIPEKIRLTYRPSKEMKDKLEKAEVK